jgi:hypothetical protein
LELQYGLESAIQGIEDSRAQLKKLAEYVTADVLVDEMVWRLLDNEAVLGKVIGCNWFVYCGAEESDMEVLELKAYLDYHMSKDLTDADLTGENDVNWDELEDRRMN